MTNEKLQQVYKQAFKEIKNAVEKLKMQNFKTADDYKASENWHKIGILEAAQLALEKQIPKEVVNITPPYGEECLEFKVVCPNCKKSQTKMLLGHEFVVPNYCIYCGQALKWGDT